jgi:hypothetical protein
MSADHSADGGRQSIRKPKKSLRWPHSRVASGLAPGEPGMIARGPRQKQPSTGTLVRPTQVTAPGRPHQTTAERIVCPSRCPVLLIARTIRLSPTRSHCPALPTTHGTGALTAVTTAPAARTLGHADERASRASGYGCSEASAWQLRSSASCGTAATSRGRR